MEMRSTSCCYYEHLQSIILVGDFHRRFGGTCCLNFLDLTLKPDMNQIRPRIFFLFVLLLGLFFDPLVGDNTFLRNVNGFIANYMTLQPRGAQGS
jgi:hypothetical protein